MVVRKHSLGPRKMAQMHSSELPFILIDPLKLLLKTLGISVEHLVEGLRKCVNELGPEASEAVKKLLVTTACGANLLKSRA